jgi:hypothetical protein
VVATDNRPVSRLDLGIDLKRARGPVGDRAFTKNAAAVVIPSQRATLEVRVGGFDEYLVRWRASMLTGG